MQENQLKLPREHAAHGVNVATVAPGEWCVVETGDVGERSADG